MPSHVYIYIYTHSICLYIYEWMMRLYSALLWIVVHPMRFTIMWGVSPQPVTVLLVCPGWPPDVSVCLAHGLLFVVGAMCSHVYCLPPPFLLVNHCFSGSTCVSLVTLVCLPIYPPGVCSPVLIRCLSSCVYVCGLYTALCLSVFLLRGGFCSYLSLFYY